MEKHLWSGENSFFLVGKHDYVAIGGGSNYAIYLDKYLANGSSNFCETFKVLHYHLALIFSSILLNYGDLLPQTLTNRTKPFPRVYESCVQYFD